MNQPINQIRSKQRVADHGEVFTPAWMVEAMLDLVKDETERIDSRFLEPACGSGNFLVRVLQRKLAAVELKFGKSDFERRHYALLALMCTYGIELLEDNIAECRANMLEILADYLKIEEADDLYRAASYVLSQNIVHGDALKMRTHDDQPITFAEWGYLGKGKFQRRDFRLDDLDFIVPRVLELTYTAWDLQPFAQDVGWQGAPFVWDEARRFVMRCELDALYFHLYQINREDVAYIMDTFPIVRRKDEAAYGSYRTKETILEMYDQMAGLPTMHVPAPKQPSPQTPLPGGEGLTTYGVPDVSQWATWLSPGPADPSVAHGG